MTYPSNKGVALTVPLTDRKSWTGGHPEEPRRMADRS
jgi:hypothetical protein